LTITVQQITFAGAIYCLTGKFGYGHPKYVRDYGRRKTSAPFASAQPTKETSLVIGEWAVVIGFIMQDGEEVERAD